MSDLFEEVLNEEAENKRVMLFRKLFPIIVGVATFLALSFGAYNWYQNGKIEENQRYGNLLVDKMNGRDVDVSALENSSSRQKELLALMVATEESEYNTQQQKLDEIISDQNNLIITRSYAKILWVNNLLNQEKQSEQDYSKAVGYLDGFTSDDQVFFSYSLLMKSLLHFQRGQLELSKESAEKLLQVQQAHNIIKDQAKAILEQINSRT